MSSVDITIPGGSFEWWKPPFSQISVAVAAGSTA